MPTATRLFMSGVKRASAGRPLRKKRKPGPKRTAEVRANCRYQLFCISIVFIMAMWTDMNRCDPISRTKTGNERAAAITKSRFSNASSAAFFAVAPSCAAIAGAAGRASYPASATARVSAATSADPRTVARSVARLTVADATPGTDANARSTLATQEAQVIPSIARSMGFAGTS